MTKISEYPIISNPTEDDILIGTDVNSSDVTKNFSIGSIIDLIGDINQGPVGPQGNTGPTGPQGPVGPAGLEWQGEWVSGTSYVADDAVGYDGASYFCILATSGTTAPNLATANWALLASQGAVGPTGPAGPIGPQGPGGGSVPKTSGAITLSATPQVLPYDINSCSFGGGKAFLPTTTENGKEIIVLAVANNIEIRANSANTNFMFVKFQTFVSSVTLATNELYRFTYIGFGGYWKAEILEGYTTENIANKSTNVSLGTSDTLYPTQNAVKTYVDANAGLPYTFWRAIINKTSVVRVLYDGIGFTSPTISNPFNGVVYVTKTGFFTSIDPNKLEFISTNLDNSGVVFVTLANQSDGVNPNNEFQVNIYDMAGGQSSTPSGNVTVEIRIYN
jgi:hypothetical protein